MATAYINLGSNIGDRRPTIGRAVALIEQAFGATARRSDWFESEPWGFDSPNQFINLGVAIETGDTTPLEILRTLREIEHKLDPSAHRDASGAYIDRTIDIDLIAVDDIVTDTPELTLPHPRMAMRDFVIIPMLQLAPDWVHPLLGPLKDFMK